MTGEQLSPEELSALLNDKSNRNNELEEVELEALTEVLNIAIGSSCNKLSELASNEISIAPPQIAVLEKEDLLSVLSDGMLGLQELVTPTAGRGAFIFPEAAKQKVTAEWLKAINHSMNQSIGTVLNSSVDFEMINITDSYVKSDLLQQLQADTYTCLFSSFDMKGITEGKVTLQYILPTYVAKAIISPLLNDTPDTEEEVAVSSDNEDNYTVQVDQRQSTTSVKPVQFSEFEEPNPVHADGNGNLNMLMDIPLKVTVELGRTKKLVKDILDLSQGSIIELDKVAGEPVDILVNSKLIAKGEVVVIDENFGVRITEILSTHDRISKLT
jgi:flagellar motor switch protein FliN